MNPRVLAILAVVVVGGAAAYLLIDSSPKPAEVASTPAAAPARPTTPVAAPPAAAPAPTAPAPAETRRRSAPAPKEAEPAAAAPSTTAAPSLATLFIDTDVAGAQVFVDRQFVGTSPATAPEVAPGSHVINVSSPGYEGVSTRVDVVPGPMSVTLKLREVRLDAKIDVIHKHRMGNCTGKLVATPQGIRYETSDKDDVFSATLLDLETFEVDYMAKNLRVKPTKGKRLDFTDPQGNADRLFVFHRDVEKARERLKKGDPPAPAQP